MRLDKEEIGYIRNQIDIGLFYIINHINYYKEFLNSHYSDSTYVYNLIKNSFGFWTQIVFLFILSNILVFGLSIFPQLQNSIGLIHIIDMPCHLQFINQSFKEELELVSRQPSNVG